MSPVAEDRRMRVRVTGILLLLAGVACGAWLWLVGHQHGVEVDELGAVGGLLPIEYVLGGVTVLLLILGSVLVLRGRD